MYVCVCVCVCVCVSVCVTVAERSAFLKLWSAYHLWSSRSALVVLQKNTEEKFKFQRIAYHNIAVNLRVWK